MPKPIYLDYNGTTPHAPEVIAAMRPFLETEFGNPSSTHVYGAEPQKAVENARRQVAALLNCGPDEIFFTSGGTESNNFAIKGIALALKNRGRHIVTSRVEHPAVIEVCRYLERWGLETTFVPVDAYGRVSPADIESALRDDTILITLMHANNEVGTTQPIKAIARLAKNRGIIMHTDAAQSLGKLPVDIADLGVDLLSVAGHKLYAPKGVGALFIRNSIEPDVFIHGAGQENGRRAGTENVLEIVGLGKACEIARSSLADHINHLQQMRDLLQTGLEKQLPDIRVNGHPEHRLPNTLSVSFKNLPADKLLEKIGPQVAASAGAACHAGAVTLSPVLAAMELPVEWAQGTIRFSTGRMTTAEEIHRTVAVIVQAVAELSGQ